MSITPPRLVAVSQFSLASGNGWSKLHAYDVTDGITQQTLCLSRSKHDVSAMYGRDVESAVRAFARMTKPYNNRQPCKRCLRRLQEYRSPLERLKEIDASPPVD